MSNEDSKFVVSTDKQMLDIELIHSFLAESYWSPGIPLSLVQKAIDNSLCFGVYCGTSQVGFARVISDFASFAYLADVFIVAEFRGRGLSKLLMNTIMNHEELKYLRRYMLVTRDAHGLYRQFGFANSETPERIMEIRKNNLYQS